MVIVWRIAAGFFLAMAIASGAGASRALSSGGAVMATLVGTIAVAAGWSWGAVLIAYFIASALISRWRAHERDRITAAIVAKGGERDAIQVFANGGVFALGALLETLSPGPPWLALATGALAASASDTWATEVGSLLGGTPRNVLTWRAVPAGMSGAVSVAGTFAALAGSAFVAALVTLATEISSYFVPILVGGVVGSTVDTVLGALLQGRRWCDRCNEATERALHRCGERTRSAGGQPWMTNDVVNMLSSLAGGLLAFGLVR